MAARLLRVLPVAAAELVPVGSARPGETKLGQALRPVRPTASSGRWESAEELTATLRNAKVKTAVLGCPEDLGPRANGGRAGAAGAWSASIAALAAMQDSSSVQADAVGVIGTIETTDLMKAGQGRVPTELRQLVDELDARVELVASAVFAAGCELVLIGGGHNNCLPLIRAAAAARRSPIAAVNLDAHLDIRDPDEGRHSGNGFSSALRDGALERYFVLGHHRRSNTRRSLALLDELGRTGRARAVTFEEWLDAGTDAYSESLDDAITFCAGKGAPASAVGIDVDLDSVAGMPSSAMSPTGVTLEQVRMFVRRCSRQISDVPYLHITEGAPILHPAGVDAGNRLVGRAVAQLVCDFLECRTNADPSY